MSTTHSHLRGDLELNIEDQESNLVIKIQGGVQEDNWYPYDDFHIHFYNNPERDKPMEEQLHDFFTKGKKMIEKRIAKKDL